MDANEFAAEATRFCIFVETAHTLEFQPRVREGRLRLASVLAAASRLPAQATRTMSRGPKASLPESWPGFGSFSAYREVLDPFDPNEAPEMGDSDISEDFLEIYRGLKDGLTELEQNTPEAALWSWRSSFDSHWGTHAVSALRVVHEAVWRLRG